MNDQKNADEVPRRQFVALSGAVGATVLLTGAAATVSAPAAAGQGLGGGPSPDPSCSTAPPGGGVTCPPVSLQGICGSPTDDDPLWHDVQYCTQGIVPPPPQPKPDCLVMTPNYIILHGAPRNTHNYLTLPTCRITGIECPFIHTDAAPNYWHEAWENARSGGNVPVQSPYIGLGINSQGARRLQQLHIHMAAIRESTQRRLQQLEADGRMATQPSSWADPANQAPVSGPAGSGDRVYRILRLPNLRDNLFTLLYRNVVRPNSLNMADQTLIVVPKMTSSGFAGSFYVLNSDTSIHDGTSTCDYLLVYT
ncbi:CDP-diacylglycerol diphosphatase [Streptomyces sp. NPDC059597]|uniref:CDP-diacylglycerol diphosphatase n=1 Tax=Streptomyces sp. NPDC059597 TaxID=3346879 RepID=UPI0036858063